MMNGFFAHPQDHDSCKQSYRPCAPLYLSSLFALLITLYNANQIPQRLSMLGTTSRHKGDTDDHVLFHKEEDEQSLLGVSKLIKAKDEHDDKVLQLENTTFVLRTQHTIYNSSEVRKWLATYNLSSTTSNATIGAVIDVKSILQRMPEPQDTDIEIYNIDAWHKLRQVLGLVTKTNTTNTSSLSGGVSPTGSVVSICLSGGSVSANARIQPTERYDIRFLEMLNETHHDMVDVNRVHLVNRAHGSRDSSHTAFLFHTYIPANTTILIWEFSVNDSNQGSCMEINNMFLTYMNQVARQFRKRTNPPLVILVYVWDKWEERKTSVKGMGSTVFQCHNRLAAAYDFVVGSINLGSYLSHLQWKPETVASIFAADRAHPNKLGHDTLAFLLWDLVTSTNREPIIIKNKNVRKTNNSNHSGTQHTGKGLKPVLKKCKKKDAKMKTLKKLQEQSCSFASWTEEVPKNSHPNPGMIYPSMISTNSPHKKLYTPLRRFDYGESSLLRMDRKYALLLPCCKTKLRLSFDLSPLVVDHHHDDSTNSSATTTNRAAGFVNVSALQIFMGESFATSKTNIQVDLAIVDAKGKKGKRTSQSNDKSVWVHPWHANEDCLIAYFTPSSWMVLQQPLSTYRIDFCDPSPSCSQSQKDDRPTAATLAHLALF